jgi:hypothetical protein
MTTDKSKNVNAEQEVEEYDEDEVLFTIKVKMQLVKGKQKTTQNEEFRVDFTLADLVEFAYQQAGEVIESDHKGWKLEDLDWEIVDEEDEDEE